MEEKESNGDSNLQSQDYFQRALDHKRLYRLAQARDDFSQAMSLLEAAGRQNETQYYDAVLERGECSERLGDLSAARSDYERIKYKRGMATERLSFMPEGGDGGEGAVGECPIAAVGCGGVE